MSNLYGQIPEFYGDGDDWNVYYERLEQFFAVNDIPDDKQSAFLISVIGSYTYKTLRDLCHPELPKEKTFQELCEYLRRQFSPQVSIFRERTKFYNACQESYENVAAWYIKVKKLSVDCRFGANLESVLLDKFITGLRSGPILDRLCEENETLSLKEALDIAVNKESALAVELPPTPVKPCYECCVPPPLVEDEKAHEEEEVMQVEQEINEPSRPASSAAGDSGFKEPQICPPMRQSIFDGASQGFGGCVAPVLRRRTSKALLGKPIGSPMAEMPLREPMQLEMCAPPPPLAMAAPPIAMAMSAPMAPISGTMAMSAPKPIMRKTMMERPLEDDENVIMEPLVTYDGATEEKKKKTRRGCRGGRKNKKRTDTENE